MTPTQAAANHRAVQNLAAVLTRWGLSDPERRAEHIALQLLADGLRPLDRPVAARGPGASRAAIEAAKKAAAEAVAAAKARKTSEEKP